MSYFDGEIPPMPPGTPMDAVHFWTIARAGFEARLTEQEWEDLDLFIQPNAADTEVLARRRAKVRRFFARQWRKVVLTDSEVTKVVTILRQENVLEPPRHARQDAILNTPPTEAERIGS